MQNYHKYNKKDKWMAIGVMSGTSCDGLDIAVCAFNYSNGKWSYDILDAETIDYNASIRSKLINIVSLSAEDLIKFNVEFGTYIGTQVRKVIKRQSIRPDLVASHGHTVFHQPEKRFTFQIGNGQAIMLKTRVPVVNDFRSLDVLLGGQGAPLVPIGDELLFGDYDYCLNLGGISNVSFNKSGERIAYDISPANLILNFLASKLGLPFDKDGHVAKSGNLNHSLLKKLNQARYYKEIAPKSLGIERIDKEFLPLFNIDIPLEDKMRTAVTHIAFQINKDISQQITPTQQKQSFNVIVTGGGAKNPILVTELIKQGQANLQYIIPEEIIVDFKEALIFAFMGILRMRGEVNVYRSVTGASSNSCSGVITLPDFLTY